MCWRWRYWFCQKNNKDIDNRNLRWSQDLGTHSKNEQKKVEEEEWMNEFIDMYF